MPGSDLHAVIAEVRSTGRQREAQCPAHNDHRKSLSVGRGDDERVLLHCHAGCAFDAIVAAAGLDRETLQPQRGPNGSRRIVATYDYTDESGALLYQVCRFEPKGFQQRKPDGNGGWMWKLSKVRRVLFGLPMIRGHKVVYIPEGEKDVLALRALGLAATCNAGGAGKWRDEYAQQLKTAGVESVVVSPDNDDVGCAHAETIASSCHAAGLNVKVLSLPNLPPKGDVSDWIAKANHPQEELLTHVKATTLYSVRITSAFTPTTIAKRYTLADAETVFARWIKDDDPIPTRAVLAAYLANQLDGDPVWLMLVGGSGVGKTARLAPLVVMPDVVLESSITGPAALLSGSERKTRAKDATGGLLRKLPGDDAFRRGVLILKDFTSIIDMHRDSRAEVLAALREVYDGRWDRSVGAEGGRTLTWRGHCGLIAGCTTAVDGAHAVISQMGTRFVSVRLWGDEKLAQSVLDHIGHEETMRNELRGAVCSLLTQTPGAPASIDAVRDSLAALGSYVAVARSPVDRDHQGEIRLVLDAEAPTRIVAMLAQIWRAAGMLGLDQVGSWELVRRIGIDSIPKLRRLILDRLSASPIMLNTTAIAEAVEHPTRTTRRALEDLTAHRVVRRLAGGEGKPDRWTLTDDSQRWLEGATLPVSSGSTGMTPNLFIRHKIETDDITGKVGEVAFSHAEPDDADRF